MKLTEKIMSLTPDNAVSEISLLLNHAHSNGKDLFVSGYEDSVKLELLAEKFFEAKAHSRRYPASLQEKLDCSRLWGRLEKLEWDGWSVNIFNVMRCAPPCNACAGNPMARIKDRFFHTTGVLFIKKEEFEKIWPGQKSAGWTSWIPSTEGDVEIWEASEDMIESAIKKEQ